MASHRLNPSAELNSRLEPPQLGGSAPDAGPFRILSLDGGGSKGFYTLGVLHELEQSLGTKLADRFDLIYGTSTGAIIAALLALGNRVNEVHELYKAHVPSIMKRLRAKSKSAALSKLTHEVFGSKTFAETATGLGIVATRWAMGTPMIFKNHVRFAHGRKSSFKPGFGVLIADAVEASCSAYPYFNPKTVTTSDAENITLIDGGFCANNPTMYAITDALGAPGFQASQLRVLSLGVGRFPKKVDPLYKRVGKRESVVELWFSPVDLLEKVLEISSQSQDALTNALFSHLKMVRVDDAFSEPELAMNLLEHNLAKLDDLRQRGKQSFGQKEREIFSLFTEDSEQ